MFDQFMPGLIGPVARGGGADQSMTRRARARTMAAVTAGERYCVSSPSDTQMTCRPGPGVAGTGKKAEIFVFYSVKYADDCRSPAAPTWRREQCMRDLPFLLIRSLYMYIDII